ncbi:MAG: helix-turn-helix transcriptional regulator [Gammaproteobacteria bacterium]|nr:helix-turn-helix transcriptional regulator [Gammaproteobacteria bacterium]
MPETLTLIAALKSALKQRGYTYADIAGELRLSESSIKRLFASGNLSLNRVQTICDWAGIDWSDLFELLDRSRRNVQQLDAEQEATLVRDTKLLMVAFLLLNHWTFEQIVSEYQITDLEGVRLLAKLDRLKIIDLLPGNKVRMRLARDFAWRQNGPIQRFFERQVQSQFFKSRFDGPGELRIILNGMLSAQSVELLQRRLNRFAAEFENMVREDRKLDLDLRRGVSCIVALRPWAPDVFERWRRGKGPDKDA